MSLLSGAVVADVVKQPGVTEAPSEKAPPNGKGKEMADSFNEPPRYIPYLSTRQPSSGPRPWIGVGDTRAALGERLRVLRDVDQVVWGLVVELTRLSSAWEAEDVVGRDGAEVDELGDGT